MYEPRTAFAESDANHDGQVDLKDAGTPPRAKRRLRLQAAARVHGPAMLALYFALGDVPA